MEWAAASPQRPVPAPVRLYGEPPAPGASQFQAYDWEQRIQDAYKQGRRDGEAAQAQAAAAQLEARLEQLARTIDTLAGYRARLRRDAEHDLVRLSLAIARRLVRRELTVDPEALLGIVKAALEKLEAGEVHCVRLHPHHAGVVQRYLEGAGRYLQVAGDPALETGSIVFETSHGTLDAGIDTQLSEIERGFTDLLPK